MKTKPILAAVVLTALCGMLFFQCKHKSDRQEEIERFLTLFALQVQGKQADSLINHFDMPQRRTAIVQLVNMLCSKSGSGKNSKAIFGVTVNPSDIDVKTGADSTSTTTFSLKFSRDTNNIEPRTTQLIFRIKEVADRSFRIVDVDAKKFLGDYIAFENIVRANTLTDADIYSAETLAAFKTADSLKAHYDSIPWFQHMGKQTYYFVVKGKMNFEDAYSTYRRKPDTAATYKMGLLGPDLKELIPVEYGLIHNIGATFPGLIEVEADHKRGFYDLTGKLILPAEYDQIFPLNDGENLAALRKGDDYYWWKKDYSVSEKDPEIKIADLLPRIQAYGKSAKLNEKLMTNVMENNSRDDHGSVYLAPSYMVDWALLPTVQYFKNPLRKNVSYENASELYELQFEGKTEPDSFLASIFYSIKDSYLGGREGLYEHKNVIVVDKKSNRAYGHDITSYLTEEEGGGTLEGKCNITKMRAVNDSLYEVVVGTDTYREMFDGKVISGVPEYHYLQLTGDRLKEMPVNRLFGFTKYVKMDDTYLRACYEFFYDEEKTKSTPVASVTPEMLRYMKNEIYAEYKFNFKEERWRSLFNLSSQYEKLNDQVDDSLTVTDKYNIAFIDQKLKALGSKPKVLAAK